MSTTEIADKVNALGTAWEQFKSVNDTRLKELEKKGSAGWNRVWIGFIGRIVLTGLFPQKFHLFNLYLQICFTMND